jgi:hypothetical protein
VRPFDDLDSVCAGGNHHDARRLRLSVADARDLAEGALRGIGYHNDEARIIADYVIDAAMCGYEYSGLAKILNVFESEHFRLPRRSMKVLRETEGIRENETDRSAAFQFHSLLDSRLLPVLPNARDVRTRPWPSGCREPRQRAAAFLVAVVPASLACR